MTEITNRENETNTPEQLQMIKEMKEIHHWRTEKGYKRKYQFREKRNYQVAEISILYMLMNEHYRIEISKTALRKSTVTNRMIRLKTLTSDNEIVHVEEIIKRRCNEKLMLDIKKGEDKRRARRRLETFKITEMIHFMIDVLDFYGYYFQSHYSTGVDGVYQNETIKRIWLKDKILFNQIEIENIGMKIHDYMIKEVDLDKIIFEKGEILKFND